MDIRYELLEQLTISKTIAILGLAALAASLSGCGGHSSSTASTSSAVTQSPSASPAVTGSRTVAAIEKTLVTAPTLAKVQADVAASTLAPLDKNRFAAFIDDHEQIANAYENKTVRDVINLQIAYEVGLRMAAQAHADDTRHKDELAKLITSKITLVNERERSIVLHIDLQNLTAKQVKTIEIGLEFDNAKGGARVGLSEIRLTRNIAPNGRIAFDYPMRYVRFGEDAGPMMASKGAAKTLTAQVTEIKYADGTDAGFDD